MGIIIKGQAAYSYKHKVRLYFKGREKYECFSVFYGF